ncbi:MAG TPA: ferritin-like domain-containing protein [Usitatibacter sp.]|nr:ferritin-like domain-containing protein [Usitatibacter sp.]
MTMQNRTQLGMNRTGMAMAPAHMRQMTEITEITIPSSEGDETSLADIRTGYNDTAEPLGSVPPPLTMKGMVKTGAKMVSGKRPHVFMDKLGERLAFERTGTRLYEAFIMKCASAGELPGDMSLDRLREFCAEEARHFKLVADAIGELGGDPTAQTPCADVAAVESAGLMQVITDPKTSVTQALHAILIGELTDNAAWEDLVVLARGMGHEEMAVRFEDASSHEAEHLANIRRWHQQATMTDAKLD